jgi:NADPH-dependent glutamate synthase beta subunit-like oxidoreductase/2,4-dienoyl-CoA reductase-like NADH-dependent reductase (Old Yellow Enzyme family)
MPLSDYQPFYLETVADLEAEIGRLGLDIPLSGGLGILAEPVPGTAIANRIGAQPITGLDALRDGSPGPLTRRRYRSLAAGGFGLVWLESTVAGDGAPSGRLRIGNDNLEAFREFVAELRGAASQPLSLVLQLATVVPETSLSDVAIEAHLDSLVEAASRAAAAGFDGIDVQACHGALPAVLLSGLERGGRFGGSFDNRSRFLREAVVRVRADHPEFLIATRLAAYDATGAHGFGTDASDYRRMDLSEPETLVARLQADGLDLLNVTCASPRLRGAASERKRRPVSDHGVPDEHPLQVLDRQLRIAAKLRAAAPGLPVVGSGFSWLRHLLPQVAAGAVKCGMIDLAGLGRGALACPDAPVRIMNGDGLDPGSTCMMCFACDALQETGGPVGCPVRDPETYGVEPAPFRRVDPDDLMAEAGRCHLCEAAPCTSASRTGTDIPAMIDAWRRGDELGAYEILRRGDVLPEMTAELTPGWLHSEGACIETALTGRPVPIQDLQHAIAWAARERGKTGVPLPEEASGRVVAVVGGGPAGIAACVRLLEHGHSVELYESSDALGGTPERAIPASRFRSPQAEIDALLAPGLESGRLRVHLGQGLGIDLDLDALCESSDAVLLAAGVWQERELPCVERVEGVVDGPGFLESAKRGRRISVPERVAILAGGDCAMDAARVAEHLGATDIFIVFGGSQSEMHWHMGGEWFGEPGHHALMECQPLGYSAEEGTLRGLRIREGGEERMLEVGLVIEAMGLEVDAALRSALPGVAFNLHGLVALTEGARTTRAGVHAAGGLTNGGASVARCIAEGLAAAEEIHAAVGPWSAPAKCVSSMARRATEEGTNADGALDGAG